MKVYTIKRLIGTRREVSEQLKISVLMFLVALGYEMISKYFVPSYSLNLYEFVGTWSGLVCVWLTRTRNILCWPWGIISSISLGIFFGQIGLPGQQWLNWIYFTIIQIWAWPYWVYGGKEKTELPVTSLSLLEKSLTFVVLLIGTGITYSLIGYFVPGSAYPVLDATVVISSIVAQFLLGKKKVESWALWLGPVNLLSITLFFLTGAYTLTVLYIAFFVHAFFALRSWNKVKI